MEEIFTLSVDSEGIGTLVFDLPGEKVNKFNEKALRALKTTLEQLEERKDLKALVIKSGKPDIYIAGADIKLIEEIQTEQEARKGAEIGHELFQKLSNLPYPTIALIDGLCLGGGLEFVLACDYRVVTDNPKTELGAPEVKLGILPGWGGTQRLPKLIGTRQALSMILSGKSVPAKKAWKIHLADGIISAEFQDDQLYEFIQKNVKGKRRNPPGGFYSWLTEENPLSQKVIFHLARKETMKKTGGHYPATKAILDVLERGDGPEDEIRQFAKLAPGRVSKNLVHLFFATEEVKKDARARGERAELTIENSAVLGGGVMGGGIAWLLSKGGIAARIKDVKWEFVAKGFEQASKVYQDLIKIRKLKPGEANVLMHNISGTLDYRGFKKMDLVIEAIVEDIEVKKKVYAELEKNVRDDTIICSNTSTFSITEMAKSFQKPGRFIGMHFFNPVNRMPLVEIIPGKETSQETVDVAVALMQRLGKTPIVVQDCTGFLVNRILIPYFISAIDLFMQGVDFVFIDRCLSRFGMPVGPFALLDQVGLDTGFKAAKSVAGAYGDRMMDIPFEFQKMREKNWLGSKTGKGFYLHEQKGKPTRNPEIESFLGIKKQDGKSMNEDEVVARLIYPMIDEAARCIQDGIVEKPAYLDLAMIMGTGFPPFRGGLLRYADEIGVRMIVDKLNRMDGKGRPGAALRSMAESNQTFYASKGED